jgi:hypothetical protein
MDTTQIILLLFSIISIGGTLLVCLLSKPSRRKTISLAEALKQQPKLYAKDMLEKQNKNARKSRKS